MENERPKLITKMTLNPETNKITVMKTIEYSIDSVGMFPVLYLSNSKDRKRFLALSNGMGSVERVKVLSWKKYINFMDRI